MSTIRALNAGAPGAGTTTELMPSLAKAWVNFDGTGITVRQSLNISSMTAIGTGQYGHNFTNAFNAATYSPKLTSSGSAVTSPGNTFATISDVTPSTTNFRGSNRNHNATFVDSDWWLSSVHGDLA